MKTTLRSLLLLLFCALTATTKVKAQDPYGDLKFPYANDSLVHEQYDQGSWEVDSRQKYVLYPDRRPDYMKFYQGSVFYLFDYIYDGNNKLLGYDLKFNFGGQDMVVTELRLIRDAQGNVIEEIVKELDQPGSPLVNRDRVLYTYNAQNKLTLEVSQEWDKQLSPAAWVVNSKSIYDYDMAGKRVSKVDSFMATNNQFTFSNKMTYEYDANGKILQELNFNELNVEKSRNRYIYNPAGYLTEEIYELKDNGNYILNSKDSMILDANNMITQEFEYNYDFTISKAVLSGRLNALGSSVGIFSESKLLKELLAYPNPTNGTLKLNVKSTSTKTVEVYNLLGEKVMELSLSPAENTIDLSTLSNGIYSIKMNTTEGNFQNKVILNK